MTKKELVGAIDAIGPSEEQKEQILLRLRQKQQAPMRKKFPSWRIAAALAAVFLLVWFASGDLFTARSPAPKMEARTDTAVMAAEEAAPAEPIMESAMDIAEGAEAMIAMSDESTQEYLLDGQWIHRVEGIEDLSHFDWMIPVDAQIKEETPTSILYEVGEEIWEVRIEEGATLLIRPMEDE